ncbi:MAG: DoxX family membrane protein [Cyclobacteriaceae bacterium]
MHSLKNLNYSNSQLSMLVMLRVLIGWHFLYEGLTKVSKAGWSSAGYLLDSKGWFAGIFHWMAESPGILKTIDVINVWGLVFIGLALMIGLFSRLAAVGGMLLLAMYYLSHPPLVGLEFGAPGEGTYLLVNKNLIELFALAVLFVLPTSHIIGLDRFFYISKHKTSPDPQVA